MSGQGTRHIQRRAANSYRIRPKAFVFFDRTTGTQRFEVKAGPDGRLPVEEATSILATQCVVRGQVPADFQLMVSIDGRLFDGLVPLTKRLIKACMATVLPTHLSQRQQEVLRAVLQNLSNKEIAAKLNVSERTVKFHVSALLKKFHVTGRVGLMQKAPDLFSSDSSFGVSLRPPVSAGEAASSDARGQEAQTKLLRMAASERRTR